MGQAKAIIQNQKEVKLRELKKSLTNGFPDKHVSLH